MYLHKVLRICRPRVVNYSHWSYPTLQRQFSTSPLSDEQIIKIAKANEELRASYEKLKGNAIGPELDSVRRKRIIYRAKQRGWLEADILMGSFASEHVPSMSSSEMDDFEIILREETIDAYNYISCKDPLPDHLKSSVMMKRLQDYAIKSNVTSPSSYEAVKTKNNLT